MRHLACISDARFIRHTAVMLYSTLIHLSGPRITIHLLLDSGLPSQDERKLRRMIDSCGAEADLRIHLLGPAQTGNFRDGYFPRSVWFRILLPELLPEVERVLYLDSDLVVCDDLAPLWELDLGSNLLAAVCNPLYPFMPDHPKDQLGFTNPVDYFNSGVLMMQLKAMRHERCVEALVGYANAHPGAPYPDQDALNHLAKGRWRALPPRWNAQSTLFEMSIGELPFSRQEILAARQNPAIVHFIGPFKPWSYLCRHPEAWRYFCYARQTPWGLPELQDRCLRNAILRQLPLRWIDAVHRMQRALGRTWGGLKRRLSLRALL